MEKLTENELNRLNEQLPSNALVLIVQKLKSKKNVKAYSKTHVKNNLTGKFFNIEIIEAAMEVRDEYLERLAAIREKINANHHDA